VSIALLIAVFLEIIAVGIAARPGVSESRRALAVALVLMLPGVGLPLALAVRGLQGTGVAEQVRETIMVPRPLTRDEVLALAEEPSALDRLMSSRPEERLDALVSVACANDANAITLLRWTVQHGPREAVLEAALTLEELDIQRARALEEAARAFEHSPSFSTAVAAGDAALVGILNGLADHATVPTLAERARAWFRYAQMVDPTRGVELHRRLSLLDGDPRFAGYSVS
jgi:hypothetical protein